MFCPNCGTELEEGSRFCHSCGIEIDDIEQGAGESSESTRFVDDVIDFGEPRIQASLNDGLTDPTPSNGSPIPVYHEDATDAMFGSTAGQQSAYLSNNTAAGQAAKPAGSNKTMIAVALIAVAAIVIIALVAFFMLSPKKLHSIQYETDGGTAIAATQAEAGSQVTSPANPTKGGYAFTGWYSDASLNEEVKFPITVQDEDIVLYAKWEESEPEQTSADSNDSASTAATESAAASTPSSTVQPVQSSTPTYSYTPTPSTTPQASSGYILPNSSSVYLSRSDLNSLTNDELEIAMNEIWARHGRLFKNNWLQSYFNSQSWYVGTIPADKFNERYKATDIEDANSRLMSNMLDERGYSVNKVHPN